MVNTRNCGSQWDDSHGAKEFFLPHCGCRDLIISIKNDKVTLLVTIALLSWFCRLLKIALVLLCK